MAGATANADLADDIKAVRHKHSFYRKNKQHTQKQQRYETRNCNFCGKQKGKCPAYG